MNLKRLMMERRTVHKYKSDLVPTQLIQEALETALYAPNHKLTYPWHFSLVGPKTRAHLIPIQLKIKESILKSPSSPAAAETIKNQIMNPSHLIVLGCKMEPKEKLARENYATVACAVQNMSLVFWAEGVGSKWSTGKITQHPKTYELLKIDPKEIEILGFLWVGVPTHIPPTPQRPPLSEFLQELP